MVSSSIIKLENVSKSFNILESSSLKQFVKNGFRFKKVDEKVIIKNCSLEFLQDDIIGVIGGNGTGKSTFLRLLCNILSPNQGEIIVNGTIAPLISLGASFNDELTAYDNVQIYSMLLNNKTKIGINKVFELADLDLNLKYQKIKFFSSGMKAKLAFATSLFNDANILLLDEIFAVGDYSFQEKAKNVLMNHIAQKDLVIIVGHDLELIKSICNKILYIKNNGEFEFGSDINRIIEGYLND